MSNLLAIDIGNTRTKLAQFRNGRLYKFYVIAPQGEPRFVKLHILLADAVIISTVGKKLPVFEGNVIRFTSATPVPVKNRYRTKFSLGSDRLAAAVAGAKRFPGRNVLVIDAGTCIKFNFVNAKGEYMGGSISPGLEMRFRALHNFTARLPLIKTSGKAELCGKSTAASIRSGVINGAVEEVKGMIDEYEKKYRSLRIIITGGDAPLFAKRLKKRIFADPYLVLKGLHEILLFNSKGKRSK